MKRWLRRVADALWRWRMKRRIAAVERQVRRQMAPVNQRLEGLASHIRPLQQQLRNEEKRATDLREQVQAHLDARARDKARQAVLPLHQAEETCQRTRTRLQEAEATYHEVLRLRDASLRHLEEGMERSRQWLERMEWARLREELAHTASRALGQVQTAGKRLEGLEGAFIPWVARIEADAEVTLSRLSVGAPAAQAEDEEALAEVWLEEFETKGRLTGEEEEEGGIVIRET
jgi:DNA repair exonuclease SbcCD ATPase subunit